MILLAALTCASATACAQVTDRDPEIPVPAANPARPTVTNPATLPPVGYLQFEQGYLGSLHSPETDTQYGLNQVTKLAVHPRLMLAISSQPFAASKSYGDPTISHDPGGIQVGFQAVLFTPTLTPSTAKSPEGAPADAQKSPIPTIAVGYYHTVYGGTASDIDLGSATNSLILLFSGDVHGFHYDTNYLLNEQDGDSNLADRTIHRAQFAQTLSVNHSLFNPNLQLSVELYHFTQPLVAADATSHPISRAHLVDLLIAPSYQLRPNLVLDFGFSHGFTSTSTQWQSFAGFTYLLPHRLWPTRK